MNSACHPLKWYLERVGRKIRRKPGCSKARGATRKGQNDDILIHNRDHAIYLFNLQEEQGYRYIEEVLPIKQNIVP